MIELKIAQKVSKFWGSLQYETWFRFIREVSYTSTYGSKSDSLL